MAFGEQGGHRDQEISLRISSLRQDLQRRLAAEWPNCGVELVGSCQFLAAVCAFIGQGRAWPACLYKSAYSYAPHETWGINQGTIVAQQVDHHK